MSVQQLPFSRPQGIWQFQILKKGISSREARGQPEGMSLGQELISYGITASPGSAGESPDPQAVPLPWQSPIRGYSSAGRRCRELSPETAFAPTEKHDLITAADARKPGSVQVISSRDIAREQDVCHLSKDE